MSAAFISTFLAILENYEVNLLENIKLSSVIIGYVAAMNDLVSAIAAKKENEFNKIFKNKKG